MTNQKQDQMPDEHPYIKEEQRRADLIEAKPQEVDLAKVRGVLKWVSDSFDEFKAIPAYIASDARESMDEIDRAEKGTENDR